MFDFKERRRFKQLLYSKPVLGVLLLLVVLLANSVLDVYGKARETAEKRTERAGDLEELKVRAAALESKIARLETERGIEEEIRSKFEVAREGEQVIILVDPEDEEVAPAEEPKRSWWQRLFDWF